MYYIYYLLQIVHFVEILFETAKQVLLTLVKYKEYYNRMWKNKIAIYLIQLQLKNKFDFDK